MNGLFHQLPVMRVTEATRAVSRLEVTDPRLPILMHPARFPLSCFVFRCQDDLHIRFHPETFVGFIPQGKGSYSRRDQMIRFYRPIHDIRVMLVG